MLAGWFALVNGWRLLTLVLSAAAAHELGHWLALRCLGGRVAALRLNVFGAVMELERAPLSYGGELAAVLAGPAVNLLCGWLLARAGWSTAAGAHAVLGVFNLLPVRPLDGGRALELLVSWTWGPEAGERAVRWMGTAVSLALAAVLFWLMKSSGGSLWLLPAACGALGIAAREMFGGSNRKYSSFL